MVRRCNKHFTACSAMLHPVCRSNEGATRCKGKIATREEQEDTAKKNSGGWTEKPCIILSAKFTVHSSLCVSCFLAAFITVMCTGQLQ